MELIDANAPVHANNRNATSQGNIMETKITIYELLKNKPQHQVLPTPICMQLKRLSPCFPAEVVGFSPWACLCWFFNATELENLLENRHITITEDVLTVLGRLNILTVVVLFEKRQKRLIGNSEFRKKIVLLVDLGYYCPSFLYPYKYLRTMWDKRFLRCRKKVRRSVRQLRRFVPRELADMISTFVFPWLKLPNHVGVDDV